MGPLRMLEGYANVHPRGHLHRTCRQPITDPDLVTRKCYPGCPFPEYSADELQDLGIMQQIVAWSSFTSAFFIGFIGRMIRRFRSLCIHAADFC